MMGGFTEDPSMYDNKRASDRKNPEDVTNGDLWEFLHSLDKKLDIHLASYKEQQPEVKELIDNLRKYKSIKWAILLLISIFISFATTYDWVIAHLKSFLKI